MRHILLFFFILFQFTAISRSNAEQFSIALTTPKHTLDSLDFPTDWAGVWTGNLEIYQVQKLVQTLPMELHILPLDSSNNYSWTIIYGTEKVAGKRDYILKTIDKTKGHYLIDEQNSIGLDAFLLDNKFYQRFSVAGNMLLTSLELQNGRLVWEIISGSLEPLQISGNTQQEGEKIPEVKSYPLVNLQRAILEKK